MKSFKEIRTLAEESPLQAIGKKLGKSAYRKEYESAIEMMLGGKSAADASKVFKHVDARELQKMFDTLNESAELEESSYTGTAKKPIVWIVSPMPGKPNPKKWTNTEVKAKTKLEAMKLGAHEMGMKPLDVKAVPRYADEAKLLESAELEEDYFNVIYKNKNGKVEGEKAFTDKKKADAYAQRGNSVDKVGGSYTVVKVKGSMDESAELEEAVSSPVEAMRAVLGTAYTLQLKSQHYHWNIQGPDFVQYHDYLGEIYEFVYGHVDVIAEQIRTLDAKAVGSFNSFKSLSAVELDESVPPAMSMLSNLADDFGIMIDVLKNARELCEGKVGIVNYLEDAIDKFSKRHWMLKAIQSRSINESVNFESLKQLDEISSDLADRVASKRTRQAADASKKAKTFKDIRKSQALNAKATKASAYADKKRMSEAKDPEQYANHNDDNPNDKFVPRDKQTHHVVIDGKVWKKSGKPVDFNGRQHAVNVVKKMMAKDNSKAFHVVHHSDVDSNGNVTAKLNYKKDQK